MRKIHGFALIVVLIFLQILTLLGLYALQMTWLEIKQADHLWQRHNAENAADSVLRDIENNITGAESCVIPITPVVGLLSYPMDWWQMTSCSGNFPTFQYYYVVENLGVDPCAEILPQKNLANYFRITLLYSTNDLKIVLQSTITTPHDNELVCNNQKHFVTLGRQMLRQIYF